MKMIFDLDPQIVKRVQKAYACKSKKQAIELALEEVLKKKKRHAFAKKLGSLKLGLSLKELEKLREDS